MKFALRILPLLALAPLTIACTSMDEESAAALFASVEGNLGSQSGQALSIDVSFETDCPRGGTAEFDGEFDSDGALFSGGAEFEYEVTFDGCADSDNKLDGVVQYVAALDTELTDTRIAVDYVYVYRGTIISEGESNGTCDFDVRGALVWNAEAEDDTYSSGYEHVYEGTLCGHDAHEVLDERYESKIRGSGTVDLSDI